MRRWGAGRAPWRRRCRSVSGRGIQTRRWRRQTAPWRLLSPRSSSGSSSASGLLRRPPCASARAARSSSGGGKRSTRRPCGWSPACMPSALSATACTPTRGSQMATQARRSWRPRSLQRKATSPTWRPKLGWLACPARSATTPSWGRASRRSARSTAAYARRRSSAAASTTTTSRTPSSWCCRPTPPCGGSATPAWPAPRLPMPLCASSGACTPLTWTSTGASSATLPLSHVRRARLHWTRLSMHFSACCEAVRA
mmetsp:Transcript_39592/g.123348  ORF Transcript_39592/g.123348 Transcript_39592/m.123348 type:complete len:255 (+) Transcript_39592:740-1504(+)